MSTRRQPQPWDRALGESAKAYSRFEVYLRMPPEERSLGKTAAEVGRSTTNIENFSAKWNWVERADAWDRHNEELNLARFEKMRSGAARKRLIRELHRQDEAEAVGDLMIARARQMLEWPIQEETVVERTEVTEDGQHLHIHQRIAKPVKWDFNSAARFIETLDKIRRSSVIDATKEQQPEGIPPQEIAERHFTLHTAEQVQQPKAPDKSMDEAPREGDWTVDEGGEGVHRSLEQRIL